MTEVPSKHDNHGAAKNGLQPMYTPPEVARYLRVKASKVISWIEAGELHAIDVANKGSRRPRYRIPLDAIRAFERMRAVVPPTPKTPRRPRNAERPRKHYFN